MRELAGDGPPSGPSAMIGRSQELRRIDQILSSPEQHRILVVGPPGIGKTALLQNAAHRARQRDQRVVWVAGGPAEQYIPYAGLHHLLRPTLDRLGRLPGPQRDALESAFGLAAADFPPEPLFVGLGALGLLTMDGAATVVVDDAHWMDAASSSAVHLMWRRARLGPLKIVLATRDDDAGWTTVPEETLALLPLGQDDARALALQADARLGRQRLRRVLELAAGNPLALQELPHVLPDELGLTDLPLVTRLERTFATRIERLAPGARRVLLAAALHESNSVADALRAATHLGGGPVRPDVLDQAERDGLITRAGSGLDFAHPLVASAVVRNAGDDVVEQMHLAVAATTRDPYAAIWHQAHACSGPDAGVADALERAAGVARSRGAIRAARSALLRAAALSATEVLQARRLVEAAELAFELGEPDSVGRLSEEARALGLDGTSAARLALLEGRFDDGAGDPLSTVDHKLARAQAALQHGGEDLAANVLEGASRTWYLAGIDDPARRAAVLRLTRRLPLPPHDPRVLLIRSNLADDDDELFAGFAAAAAGDVSDPGEEGVRALAALAAGDWDSCHALASRACTGLHRQGRLSLLTQALALRALSGFLLGRWEDVAASAEQAQVLAQETEQAHWGACAMSVRAALAALQGETALAGELTDRGTEYAVLTGNTSLIDLGRLSRGLTQLGAEDYDGAYQTLLARLSPGRPDFHRGQSRWAIDYLAEAAVGAGRAAEAGNCLAAVLGARAHAPAQQRATALARAVLAPQDLAEEAFRVARLSARGAPAWFRARLDLNHGMWLRRQRRQSEARDLLQSCLTVFEHLGAVAWADRTRRELATIGRRAHGANGMSLTAQELQIAQLAAAGLTNKQIGQRLYVSPRTVGSHLHRVFAKLDVQTRSQLHLVLPPLR